LKITVVGLGKIGLPLAAQYSSLGHFVYGCDVNPSVVETVNAGKATFGGEPGLGERIAESVQQGLLVASTNTTECVRSSDVAVVVVPLLVDDNGNPKFELLESAATDIGKGLKQGALVVFETTLPVGTTRNRLAPILEANSGLIAGTDFFVAFSPERVYSGNVFENLKEYPKLVGGINHTSSLKAVDFYKQVLTFNSRPELARENGVWNLGSSEAAEFAKLAETTYRDVNIGLANQFAVFSAKSGIDIHAVIEACNSQPFSKIHQPGIAVGGHCIPVYPHFYLQGDPGATIVQAARQANINMPRYAVDLLENALSTLRGKEVVILGLAYRGGVKEHAFSGTWPLVTEISKRGGVPKVHDPLYSHQELMNLGLTPAQGLGEADALILQTNHKEYLYLRAEDLPKAEVFLDGRNFAPEGIRNSSLKYINLGHPVEHSSGQ